MKGHFQDLYMSYPIFYSSTVLSVILLPSFCDEKVVQQRYFKSFSNVKG